MLPKAKLLGLVLLCCALVVQSRLWSQKTGFESRLHYYQLYDPEQVSLTIQSLSSVICKMGMIMCTSLGCGGDWMRINAKCRALLLAIVILRWCKGGQGEGPLQIPSP